MDIKKELNCIIEEYDFNINTDTVLKEMEIFFKSIRETTIQFPENYFEVLSQKIKPKSKIVICGAARYFMPYIKKIKNITNNIVVFDDFIKKVDDIIITNNETILADNKVELFIVTPRDKQILNNFKKRIKFKDRVLWIVDIINDYENIRYKTIDTFVNNKLNKNNSILFLGGFFSNNYTPTFNLLVKNNYNVNFILLNKKVEMVLGQSIHEINNNVLIVNKYEFFYLLSKLPSNVKVFMNWDSFRRNNFSGLNALSTLLYVTCFLRILKSEKILLLYDPSPLIKQEFEYSIDIIKAMKLLTKSVDKIIYNSSTQDMREYQKNLFDLTKSTINFYRYNKKFKKPIPKRSEKDFHLIMIGVFLDNTHDPMRSGMRKYIKNILNQKIHMHYLSYIGNDYKLEHFIDSLTENQKKYFHIESNIFEQDEMIEFISQFNAGWMLHNTNAMCETISKSYSQEYKDMMHVFLEATVTSSILAHGCAGLPIFINRSMQGIQKEFPKEFFIPIELSETKNIRKIIESIDWKERYKFCYENRGLFSIEDNIDRLIKFLQGGNNAKSANNFK